MKVLLTERVRTLQKDPQGAKALREFIATARLNERREIRVCDEQGHEVRYVAKLISQG